MERSRPPEQCPLAFTQYQSLVPAEWQRKITFGELMQKYLPEFVLSTLVKPSQNWSARRITYRGFRIVVAPCVKRSRYFRFITREFSARSSEIFFSQDLDIIPDMAYSKIIRSGRNYAKSKTIIKHHHHGRPIRNILSAPLNSANKVSLSPPPISLATRRRQKNKTLRLITPSHSKIVSTPAHKK